MSSTVKAVGFAYSSPEVILLFSDHDRQQLHVYPPKDATEQLKFTNDGRKHLLLLLSVDSLPRLTQWSSKLHRVLVFGKAEDLLGLKLPVLDADTDDDGRVIPYRRQTRDEMLDRIENEAVVLKLDNANTQRRANKRVATATAYSGPTFRDLLKGLKGLVRASADASFTFADDIGVPSVMRLMGDTSQKEYRAACERMIKVGGVDDAKVKVLFKWVEGIDGIGPELSKAIDAYLYPDEESADPVDIDALATQYGVAGDDVRSVSKVYKRLQDLDD